MKVLFFLSIFALSFNSFAGTKEFSCNTQAQEKIKKGDKLTINSFLKAVAEYNVANEEFANKIKEQNLLRDISKSASSVGENHKELLPQESLNIHSSLNETREILSSMEDEQNKEEASALQKIFDELAPCESAYLGE